MDTEEDRRLCQLLKRAYIEARYSRSYRITNEELAVLGERVKDLAAWVGRSGSRSSASRRVLGRPDFCFRKSNGSLAIGGLAV